MAGIIGPVKSLAPLETLRETLGGRSDGFRSMLETTAERIQSATEMFKLREKRKGKQKEKGKRQTEIKDPKIGRLSPEVGWYAESQSQPHLGCNCVIVRKENKYSDEEIQKMRWFLDRMRRGIVSPDEWLDDEIHTYKKKKVSKWIKSNPLGPFYFPIRKFGSNDWIAIYPPAITDYIPSLPLLEGPKGKSSPNPDSRYPSWAPNLLWRLLMPPLPTTDATPDEAKSTPSASLVLGTALLSTSDSNEASSGPASNAETDKAANSSQRPRQVKGIWNLRAVYASKETPSSSSTAPLGEGSSAPTHEDRIPDGITPKAIGVLPGSQLEESALGDKQGSERKWPTTFRFGSISRKKEKTKADLS